MKKCIFIVTLCFLSVLLISCAVPYSFMHCVPDIDAIQIEIVNLKTEMGHSYGSPYSEEHVSVIKIIENDKKEDFLYDFRKIKSYQPFGTPIGWISGVAIRIIYPNGDIELITNYGTATVENGEIRIETTTFDSDAFYELIDKYS